LSSNPSIISGFFYSKLKKSRIVDLCVGNS
jgi:hypothetical protein